MLKRKTAKLGPAIDELLEELSVPGSTPAPVAAPVRRTKTAVPLIATIGVLGITSLVGIGIVAIVYYSNQPTGQDAASGAPVQTESPMWVGNTGGLGACLRTEPNEKSKQAKPCYIDGKQVMVTGLESNGYMLISQPDKGWVPKGLLLTARPAAATAPPTPSVLTPNPTPIYTSTASAQAGAIAVPDLKLSIPSYTQVYRNGEKLPFEITLVGAPGAYKEGQLYNNYEILVMLFQACCAGPQIFLNSDATGRIKGDIPLRNLPPGTYYLEAHPSTLKTKTYEGFRRAPNSSAEAEKYYPLFTKRIELKIEN